jgi:hypothetical protein
VDVKLLLNNLKPSETDVGEWVNVIGYVMSPQMSIKNPVTGVWPAVSVQAIVLWPSGPLKLHKYEKCLDQQKIDTIHQTST